LVEHGDNVSPANLYNWPIAPTPDQFASNPQLDRARGAFLTNMAGDEIFGDRAVRVPQLGSLGFPPCGFLLAGVDTIMKVTQNRSGALSCLGERHQRI
jgi:hypothetical protein